MAKRWLNLLLGAWGSPSDSPSAHAGQHFSHRALERMHLLLKQHVLLQQVIQLHQLVQQRVQLRGGKCHPALLTALCGGR